VRRQRISTPRNSKLGSSLGSGMYIIEEVDARRHCSGHTCQWIAYYPKPVKESAQSKASATGSTERKGIESLIRPSK
jgi:hypothetical protein